MAFSLLDLLILLVVAGVCGGIAMRITGYSQSGCLMSIATGFIGALVGLWLKRLLELPEFIEIEGFPVIWSIIGAALFVAVLAFLTGRRPPVG